MAVQNITRLCAIAVNDNLSVTYKDHVSAQNRVKPPDHAGRDTDINGAVTQVVGNDVSDDVSYLSVGGQPINETNCGHVPTGRICSL